MLGTNAGANKRGYWSKNNWQNCVHRFVRNELVKQTGATLTGKYILAYHSQSNFGQVIVAVSKEI